MNLSNRWLVFVWAAKSWQVDTLLKSLYDLAYHLFKRGSFVPESSKSVRYDVVLNKKYTGKQFSKIVEKAADELNVYISHIGGYSRVKYPNSIHWHFKESPKEKGCLDATFWEEGNEFWIVARNYEPQWVKDKAVELQKYLRRLLNC